MNTAAYSPLVHAVFDPATWTMSYVVHQGPGSACAVIDPVLDYDPKSGRSSQQSADKLIEFIRTNRLTTAWILETHAHADHLSAASYLKQTLGGKIGIGRDITAVQKVFKGLFNLEAGFAVDGSQFDHLFADDEVFEVGDLRGQVIHVPGHTPACVAYKFGDAMFVGDTLFMPDVGTARCDFPGGSAQILYQSIQRLLGHDPKTRIFVCHDYPPAGRAVAWESTVAQQKTANIHVHDGITQAQFVEMRTKRDAGLAMPVLILPSVQVNIRAGALPPKESNGVAYLKIPLNAL